MVDVPTRQIQVVEHEHDRALFPLVEVGEEIEDLDLVSEIEERRRLVEQHDGRALGERHRDPGPLAPEATYAWGGGESRAMTAVRKYVRHELGMPRQSVELVAYWRQAGAPATD
jgi:NADPH-dependent ferric siderophore reductase